MSSVFKLFVLINIIIRPVFISGQDIRKEIDSVNSIQHGYITSNPQRAINLFSENLQKARLAGYKYGTAVALSKLALFNYIKGNYDKSTEEWIESIKLFEEMKRYEEISFAYTEFGYQFKRRDLTKGNYYMRIGINIAERNNFSELLSGQYDNYGVLKEMENNLDSAMYFYRKALDLKVRRKDTLGIPFSLNNIAGIFALQGNFSDAFKYLNISDKYRWKETGCFGRAENLSLRADLYSRIGKADSAIIYYRKCLEISKAIKCNYLIHASYEQLTALYRKKSDYKNALETLTNYIIYKDSILNKETNEHIADLQIAFESERKDKIIAENNLAIEHKSFQLIILCGIIGFLVLTATFIYRNQKQKRERIKNELELKNQLNKSEMENKLRSEKLRISRDLHDNIGSQMTLMISSLDNLTYYVKDQDIQKNWAI